MIPSTAEATEAAVLQVRARGHPRVRSRSAAVWLGAIVGASAAVRFALAATVPAPAVFPDETIYAELARSVSASGEFLVRDLPFSAWTFGPLYVLIISPAYLMASLPDAYLVVKVINSLLMSLAALPAYFLARRVVGERLGRLAAVFAVLLPAMAYSSRVMTESAFYPVFLVAVLAMVRMLEAPTRWRQLVVLGTIGLACGVRPQAMVLLPALLTAICWHAVLEQRAAGALSLRALGGRLSTYRATGLAVLASAAAAAVVSAGVNGGPAASLWERATYVAERVSPLSAPKWIVYHVAELDLALGVVPFVAALLFVPFALDSRKAGRGIEAFTVAAAATTAWIILLAGTFASQADVARIQERYVFYVQPLLLIAFLGWIEAGKPRHSRPVVLVAAAIALLPLLLPYEALLNYHAFASTPGLVPWLLSGEIGGALTTTVIVGVLTVGAVFAVTRSRGGHLLSPVVAAFLIVNSLLVTAAFQTVSARSLAVGLGNGGDRDWIDRAVGGKGDVTVVWSGAGTSWMRDRRVWESEFFNRQVGSIYYVRRPLAYDLPQTRARLRAATFVTPDGRALRAEYVLSDGPVIVGRRVASRPGVGLTLYRVDGLVRLLATSGNTAVELEPAP